ncbi:Eco57I restriction-modification methylase domain-containing protein [Virgibacillus sp. C22-A2]|uniref:site-specific DNA-methyltransferase (adenine-specific) n=1 Tax=Virgibacillus tibetensis TaxID=3042313 RepID=A0ABU6KG79_9BACI|nr:Eco57I restriction-modification methylase domain-containing protein [Virgibacillus sp. C22-A2]
MIKSFFEQFDTRATDFNIKRIESINKGKNEQFFTPMIIASYMSSMLKETKREVINFLDPGVGIGNLTIAFIANVCNWKNRPNKIHCTLFEIDSELISVLENNLEICKALCKKYNIEVEFEIINSDFILEYVRGMKEDELKKKFDYISLNPPYKKLNTESYHKKILSEIGIDVPNYYAAFVLLSINLLKDKGQLVCITPRSFCNGQYFKSYRKFLSNNVKLEKIHNFNSRKDIFYDDILQEAIIMYVSKNKQKFNDRVEIIESIDNNLTCMERIKKRYDNIVFPDDTDKIIRIIKDDSIEVVEKMHQLPYTLEDLNINVSTGPIVDFREKEGLLSFDRTPFSVPIIYPENFYKGLIRWPLKGKKPPFLIEDKSNIKNLRSSGVYVLVKRFSSMEEKKRIVAAVYNSDLICNTRVGFDNKTNYYHITKNGIKNIEIAKGLSLYLNSSLVNFYFRTFSGNTQVNIADLKLLKYPSISNLLRLGRAYEGFLPSQAEIDNIIDTILFKKEKQ